MFKQIAGSLGSIFASLCCLGFAPLLAALSAAGLGFAISDAVLIPLLTVFLGITLWGLHGSRRRHGNNAPFYLGAAGAVAALAGVFVFIPIHVIGLLALVGASAWDIVLVRKNHTACGTTSL
ncbi:MAG: MerC family mercury resistance protein [Gammaproteobacteria bacterium]|nr:MerC family mercury resistance protein [Gammaproteobacteria bacterium]